MAITGGKIVVYDEDYIKKVFVFWYETGRPTVKQLLEYENFPADQFGRKPVAKVVNAWINERGWREYADALDAQVETQINDELVAMKVAMLRHQASQAKAIKEKAVDFILENGFDSSASAVAGFKVASEIERLTIGLSKTIERLAEMSDDEVLQSVRELSERAGVTIDASEIPEDSENSENSENSEGDAESLD